MNTDADPGLTPNTPNPSPAEILEQYDAYIKAQARDRLYQRSSSSQFSNHEMDIDDLTQRVRIKFWTALVDHPIAYPKAYIRTIVNSEIVDMLRRRKPVQSLALDEEGEIYYGRPLVEYSLDTHDPAEIFEQRSDVDARLKELVAAIPELGRRQRAALLCTLYDHADDPALIASILKTAHVTITTGPWEWPASKSDKHLLLASLPYARRKVASFFKDRTTVQKKYLSKKRGAHSSSCEPCSTNSAPTSSIDDHNLATVKLPSHPHPLAVHCDPLCS